MLGFQVQLYTARHKSDLLQGLGNTCFFLFFLIDNLLKLWCLLWCCFFFLPLSFLYYLYSAKNLSSDLIISLLFLIKIGFACILNIYQE